MSLVVKELSARDVENYRERAQAISGSTMREHYELEMDRCIGYSKAEIEELVAETQDEYKKAFLRDLRPRGDGRAILRQVSPMTWTTQTYETAFGAIVKRRENCYDIIFMRAKQIRELNKNKLTAAALDTITKGVAGFAVGGFWGGAAAAGLTAKEKADKLAADLEKDMPSVVAGYIANELITRKVLALRDDDFYLAS